MFKDDVFKKNLNLLLEKWELERTYDNGKKKVYKFYKSNTASQFRF